MRNPDARPKTFALEGVSVNVPSLGSAVSMIADAARGDSFTVCTLNLDHVAKLRAMPRFRAAYARARFVTADGFPIAALARLSGMRVSRTTGADLVLPLCAEAARRGLRVFLFGSAERTLEAAARHLRSRVPGLEIVGTSSPRRLFNPYSEEGDRAIERIRESGADLCFVALGAPLQELFSARAADRVGGVGFVCVGAGLDFLGGAAVRAPRILRVVGLEWLWRLLGDRRRLAGRYGRCAVVGGDLMVRVAPRLVADRIRWSVGRP